MIRLVLLPLALCLATSSAVSHPGYELNDIRALIDQGKYAQAEQVARLRLDLLAHAEATDSLQVASTLDLLAESLRRGGRGGSPEAEEACDRALRIKKERLGDKSAGYAASLYQLGFLLYGNGDRGRAKSLLEESLRIREEVLGREHRDVAETLIPLAGLLSDQGNNAQSESLFTRAMDIRVREYGSTSPQVGECLSALATLRFRTGDFAEAASTYEQALPILEQSLGVRHPKVGTCLNNLGALLYELGDYEESLERFNQALQIRRQSLGRGHELVASTQVNIGKDLAALGRVKEAATRYDEALTIQEERFGHDALEVGRTLSNLGLLALQIGSWEKARTALTRSVSILKRDKEDEDPPELADALAGLAAVEAATGHTGESKSMYDQALRVREHALGRQHPDVGLLLTQYARMLAASGDPVAAIDKALEAENVSREHLRLTSRSLSERQALQYAKSRPAGYRTALLALSSMTDPPHESVARVWDSVVQGRTLVLDEMALRNQAAAAVQDSTSREIWNQLGGARRRLANLLVAGPRGDSPARYRTQLDQARDDMDRVERSWASRSASYRIQREREHIGLSEVEDALPENGALIAYALAGDSVNASYIAFVARRNAPLAFISLGRADAIETKISQWLKDLTHEATGQGSDGDSRASGARVRRVLWDPIEAYISESDRLFVVPEGAIHLVNFAALPVGRNEYLIETGRVFHYMAAERDLVPGKDVATPGVGMLAVGNPAYDGPGVGAAKLSGQASRGATPGCVDFDSLHFGSLPGSGREVQDVVRIWGKKSAVTTLVGTKATERAFKAMAPGRSVLHVATHGFFLGECSSGVPGSRGIGIVVPSKPDQSRKPNPYHPLLLSGLALANANRRASAKLDEEDGILTAEEVACLDLSGVQWAVLSACDTGNGRVIAGEGILGMQRAFEVAGVRTVIMSLWAVDDDATRAWMAALYQGRISRNLDTATAVANASLQVLHERRAQARSTSPFYWAGFVATGDWR